MVPEANDTIALAFQKGSAASVVCSVLVEAVLFSIEFDDQASLVAGEVDDVAIDWGLPSEMGAVDRYPFQMMPEGPFWISSLLAQVLGIGKAEAVERTSFHEKHQSGWHRDPTLPSMGRVDAQRRGGVMELAIRFALPAFSTKSVIDSMV
ncbi:hypothetical protein BA190_21270 [Labrys sp. WJW]|nr:hypothetical protein BA190_21270 [Labrys sp. WJW]